MDEDGIERIGPEPAPGRFQWFVNAAGAATSLALVGGVLIWGYDLAMRDVAGIPVVRAFKGPMRIAPQEPGGEIASNVGLSVNEVAAEGSAAPLPDQMVLAPRPVDLAADDQPIGAPGPAAPEAAPVTALASAAEQSPPGPVVPVEPVEHLTETPTPDAAASQSDAMETAVEGALAEALGTVADTSAVVASAEPARAGTVTRSPRPARRPEGDGSAEAAVPPVRAGAADEVDVASVVAGTQLVQLGAFDDEAGARAEWARLQAKFGDLIAPKALVLQQAESSGRRFVRLRALGFEDEADARRFCSALLAENASCIPVAHRL